MHAAHSGSWLNPDPNNLEDLYAIFADKQHGHYEHRIAAYIALIWGERQMTVIAYFSTKPFPFFVSDMLLSKERRPGEVNDIYLPTVGNLRDFERFTGQGLPFIATRMVRKPFAVHGRRAYVAWAGPVAAGEILYKALFGLLEGDLEVEAAIDDAFSRLPLHYQREVSAIVAYADTDAETVKNAKPAFKVVQRNCESLYLPVLGQCYFGGSGGGALLTWIKERGQLLTTRLIPGSLGTLPDAICQKLVFEETFVRLGAPSPFSSLLEGGCGGFYESLQLRYSPEPIDPLTTCHLHLRVIEDTIEVTRCIIYFTKPSVEEPRRRIAFIASLVNRPCQIVPSKARAHQISYEIVDIVACAPFWDDTSNKEHKHMTFGAADEIWSKAEISIEVVALTMFTDQASIPLEAVAQLSDEGQFRAVNELATRSQTVTTLNEPSSPVVELRRSNDQATICLDLVWLLPLVERFRSTDTSPHVVISDEDGFRVLT